MSASWPTTVANIRRMREGPLAEPFQLALGGIEKLAVEIAEGPLALILFGWTSMFDLCIQQTDAEPYSCAYLRVSALQSGMIEFRYIDTAITERQWHREVSPDTAAARFATFLEELHWVGRRGRQTLT